MAKPIRMSAPEELGGFSSNFDFWWTAVWPEPVYQRTRLPRNDLYHISINLLKYAAIIFGLAGTIVTWEMLPVNTRPSHPMILLWTDNTTAKAWTKKISGIKMPQGRSLARIFTHLLMFSDVGIEADHIEGEKNNIANFLSRLYKTHKPDAFTYATLQIQFPWLKLSRRFIPSNELLALVFSALSQPSVKLPTTRVKLGQMIVTQSILKQNFFGLST
jgi:hypothetical protein